MANVGYATLQIIPSARGFGTALTKETSAPLAAGGKTGGKKFGGGLISGIVPGAKMVGGALAAMGVLKVAKDSVALEAEFSKTMNTMGAVANVPKKGLESLSNLALKLGADTSFSASEAADAMLELAKAGITPADIKAGALAGTLTLAAAGGTDLATASTIAANAMNAFGLKGSKMNSIAAALAGGANASSASVESLGQALSQVGPGAVNAGLSLQETIATLSAFDAAGIKGSDAGTSLKTMLTRLVPATDKAQTAMEGLGLDFTKANGDFVSISNVAQQLHDKLRPLAPAARSAALQTLFGADAQRAATVLMKEGSKGLAGYIKATKDQDAATRAANARMGGTAGALERLSGSFETVQLKIGLLLAPAIQKGAGLLEDALNAVGDGVSAISSAFSGGGGGMSSMAGTFKSLVAFGRPLWETLKGIGRDALGVLKPGLAEISKLFTGTLLPAFRAFLPAVQPIANFILKILGSAVVGVLSGVVDVVKGVMKTLAGIFNVFAGLLTGDWSRLWKGIKQIVSGVFSIIKGAVKVWWNGSILAVFKKGALFLTKGIWKKLWDGIKGLAKKGMDAAKSLISKAWSAIKGVFSKALSGIVSGVKAYLSLYLKIVRTAFAFAKNFISGVWSAIRSVISNALSGVISRVRAGFSTVVSTIRTKIGDAVGFVRELPGKAMDALRNIGSTLLSAGSDLIGGFIQGIRNRAGDIITAIRAAITDRLPGYVKKALGINSPSRVFMEIGGFTAEGMAVGLEKGARRVSKAARALVDVPGSSAGGAITGRVAGAGAGGAEIHIHGDTNPDVTAARVARRLSMRRA